METKKYVGRRNTKGDAEVCVQDTKTKLCKPLDPGFAYLRHSPNGFAWGYLGSGPAQLAFAILLDHFGEPGPAVLHYQDFKFSIIASFAVDEGLEITTEQIENFLAWNRVERSRANGEATWQSST
jgi:hypothetical protein